MFLPFKIYYTFDFFKQRLIFLCLNGQFEEEDSYIHFTPLYILCYNYLKLPVSLFLKLLMIEDEEMFVLAHIHKQIVHKYIKYNENMHCS